MIGKIKLKSGSTQGEPNLEFDVTPITIFVGPNNSGKSRVLIELENFSRRTHGQANDFVLDSLTFSSFTQQEIEEEITKIESVPDIGENVQPGHVILSKINPQNNSAIRQHFNKQGLINEAQNPNNRHGHYQGFLNMYTMRLDGTNRLNLLVQQPAGDLQKNTCKPFSTSFREQ